METEIGSLEHDLHSVFADNCVPSENTVYSPDLNVLEALDEYCAESTFHEIKKPLVLIGPPGCGKSAALANWLLSRKKAKENNKSRLSSLNPQEEFIFWHVVGCSRQSTNVGHMLNRLMTELRGHFEITREVSEGEDALSWDFPPFLELAVAKGKVLLVIDGVHRLRSEDGEAKLNWLPLRFPPNVRVVLSATDNFNSMFPKDALSITPTINQTSPNNNKNNKHVDAQTQANTLQNSGGGGGGSGPVLVSHKELSRPSSQSTPKGFTDSELEPIGDRSSIENIRCDRVLRELLRREWNLVKMQYGIDKIDSGEEEGNDDGDGDSEEGVTDVSMDMIKKFLTISSHQMMHDRSDDNSLSQTTQSSVGFNNDHPQSGGHPPHSDGFFKLTSTNLEEGEGEDNNITSNGINGEGDEMKSQYSLTTQEQLHQINDQILSSGITLFPSQINALRKISGGNPLFLSVTLRCLKWSLNNGYSSKTFIKEIISCKKNIVSLYSKILDIWEHGQEEPSYDEREAGIEWAKSQGGLPALRDCHPIFEKYLKDNHLNADMKPIHNHPNLIHSSSSTNSSNQSLENNNSTNGSISQRNSRSSTIPPSSSASQAPLTERIDEGDNEDLSSVDGASVNSAVRFLTESYDEASSSSAGGGAGKESTMNKNNQKESSLKKKKDIIKKKKKMIEIGCRVEALYGGGDEWYSGVVEKINEENNTYFVRYDDGDEEDDIAVSLIKREGGNVEAEEEDDDDDYEEDEDDYEEEEENKTKETGQSNQDEEEDDDDGYSDDDFVTTKKNEEEEEEEEEEKDEQISELDKVKKIYEDPYNQRGEEDEEDDDDDEEEDGATAADKEEG